MVRMASQFDPSPEAKTSIDSLLELLKEKGKMDLNTISITLGVSPTIIEDWARVLENGKLIKVNYEVGKMFLEIRSEGGEQARSTSIRAEAQKSALQNEMDVERITLDKYAKNLEDLSLTVAGMDSLYKQKLPNIQKLFYELDTISAPMAKKTKELDATMKSAESYFVQLDKKVDELYSKVTSLEGSNLQRALRQKEETLKLALSRADSAKATLMDIEDTKQALYSKMSGDIDAQVREFKAALKASIEQIYNELKADASEAITVDKEIRTELAETAKVAAEAERIKKDVELSKTTLTNSRNSFKDRYQKTVGEIDQISGAVMQKYEKAQAELNELKTSMGEVSRIHDSIGKAKVDLAEVQKTINTSRDAVESITAALRALDTNRNLEPIQKAKVVAELTKKSLDVKQKGDRIRKSLDDVEGSMKNDTEEKGGTNGG
jgi:Mn-dependent DtxR family transcriptional regulator